MALIGLILPVTGFSQTIPVGDLMEEQIRIQQLMNDSLSHSFSNRSVWMNTYDDYMDDADQRHSGWWTRKLQHHQNSEDSPFRWGIYNPVFQTTYNSKFPHGENNGAAWYGRGITSEIMGGGYITSDYVTISIRPHLSYQQNRDFEVPRFIPRSPSGDVYYQPEQNILDTPFRFGPDPYSKYNLGHSSIRLHYKKVEVGASTEPMTWGPAVKYPLMFSNNAEGLRHLFLSTREPIDLPLGIGAFEFRWIIGWPKDTKYYYYEGSNFPRLTNSVNVIYSPGFLDHFHIGLSRTFNEFIFNGRPTRTQILGMFDPFRKSELDDDEAFDLGGRPRDQKATAFFRWVVPDANAEIYGELFREDHSWDFRDFLMQPIHNSAYMFGFQKLFFTPGPIDFFRVNAEFTNLTASRITEVRAQSYFYTHGQIRQGHTNNGQILGAAVGPGSNSQFLSADAYFNDYRVGLFVQRHAINDHLHYALNRQIQENNLDLGNGDQWNHRININIGANVLWHTGPFILESKVTVTNAMNYGRFGLGEPGTTFDNFDPYDVVNVQMQIGGRYVF